MKYIDTYIHNINLYALCRTDTKSISQLKLNCYLLFYAPLSPYTTTMKIDSFQKSDCIILVFGARNLLLLKCLVSFYYIYTTYSL